MKEERASVEPIKKMASDPRRPRPTITDTLQRARPARDRGQVMSADQVKRFYDRFGFWQDWQPYENRALAWLIQHGDFAAARAVFEFGCGTGRFAERLLRDHLPPDARYVGVDVSDTMVRLATEKLKPWSDRASVVKQPAGTPTVSEADGQFDRFVSTYVIDLLSDSDTQTVLADAHRILLADGSICLASLTIGPTPLSRAMMSVWCQLSNVEPEIVGGCRPVRLLDALAPDKWHARDREILTEWGVASEIIVASRRQRLVIP